ncbi:type 1 glutamine amidotransferase domain-containing protein [Hymenobacter latericus]|uniref:type 1 glutamine amidotransferase domain-containing protein n=1 Tax=Hymenobacter sp. YIM 151858-1 TaxID=2987688 RepID=UPI0022275444|nr:type 1 glutamine amidotransferase domain-containing protein [Hymenobacter sp. YIM 151858-1]UYZ57937.1 type 1 glutamine amidotransferase [Hymenobacter sp. YIM 151858-1]
MSIFGNDPLKGKKVAVLATDGFEQSELEQPVKALKNAGADVEVVSLKSGSIKGWDEKDWGSKVSVDKTLDEARPADYDALVLPGGQMNPDVLRTEPKAVSFAADFMKSGKVVAAICHGPWTLVETGLVRGKNMTSWPSLKTDLTNAGAQWQDATVVVDGNLITSRNPQDLPAFNEKLIEKIGGTQA